MAEKLLTLKEVSEILEISEDEVKKLVEEGKIPAYKIAGSFLRFKIEQVELFKAKMDNSENEETSNSKTGVFRKEPRFLEGRDKYKSSEYNFFDRIKDFFRFYDFYILAVILIIALAMLIFYKF